MKIIRKKITVNSVKSIELFTTHSWYDYDYLMDTLRRHDCNEIYFFFDGQEIPCTSPDDYSLACRLFQVHLRNSRDYSLPVT